MLSTKLIQLSQVDTSKALEELVKEAPAVFPDNPRKLVDFVGFLASMKIHTVPFRFFFLSQRCVEKLEDAANVIYKYITSSVSKNHKKHFRPDSFPDCSQRIRT